MATIELLDRTRTGLVIFDMQKGQFEVDDPERRRWLAEAHLLDNTVRLLDTARSAGIPVFYVQNNRRPDFADQKEVLTDAGGTARGGPVTGTRGWEILDEIKPRAEDYIIPKYRQGAFSSTPFDTLLRARGIDTIIIAGVRTTVGIETTVRDGRDLGYNVVVVSDCTGGVSPEDHRFTIERIFPMLARVRTGAQVASMLEVSTQGDRG